MAGLQFAGLKPQTVKAYRKALQGFFNFLQDLDEPLSSTYRHLDRQLSAYIEHLRLDDYPITYAGHVMSGLRRFLPEARWRVPRARQFFTNRQSIHVTRQAPPLPATVALAFAGLAVETGQFSLAAVILVGYLAFLRAGEMIALRPAKIAVDVQEGRILLALPSTKMSRQREETVAVEDPRVAKLVASVVRAQPNSLQRA